jgi:hypothetical protein
MIHVFLFLLSIVGALLLWHFGPVVWKAFNSTMKDANKIEDILDNKQEEKKGE